MKTNPSRSRSVAITALAALSVLAACGDDDTSAPDTSVTNTNDITDAANPCDGATGSVTVYSGRSESLVSELYDLFTATTGVTVEARYGDSGELAGQILTEDVATPADVFFSQDAGALGAVSAAGLFTELPDGTLDRVSAEHRSTENDWVGASGRARVILYNPSLVTTPPTSVDELLDPAWKGRIGFAPTNASWQSFVTALRVTRGEDGAREWLEAFAANDPVAYEKNGATRDAVNAGEVALGLVNHYYLFEKIAAEGADAVVAKNQYLPGDIGGLVNVAGAGVLANSDNDQAAQCLVSFFVSDEGQEYFVAKTFEYPLVDGIAQAEGLPTLDELDPPTIDLANLSSIAETQELLANVGLLTL